MRSAQFYHCGKDVTHAVWGALSSEPFQQTLRTLEKSVGESTSRDTIMFLPGFKRHSFGGYKDVTLSVWKWINHPILDPAKKKNPRLRAGDLQIVGGCTTECRSISHEIRQDIAFIMYEGFLLK